MDQRNNSQSHLHPQSHPQSHSQQWPLHSITSDALESKFNMYERQIDQLFDFTYKEQDDIKTLFQMKDSLEKHVDMIDQKINNTQLNELKVCIQNYYHLELDNKRRMENIECYQFQLFIVQIVIIGYLLYSRFI